MEKVPILNQRGEVTKYKERERPVPEELSSNDKTILKKVRKRAYRWDMSFRCCCFRAQFGWSSIIGMIPFIGDFADLLIALWLVKKCSRVDGGLPKNLYGKMMMNIMVDFAIGLVPFVGDLADAFFRANTRNAWLLDAYLSEKANAMKAGKVQDPDSGNTVSVTGDFRTPAQVEEGRHHDVEMGVTQAPMSSNRQSQRGRTK